VQRILLIGGTGLLGPYIINTFKSHYKVYEASRHSDDYICDLNNKTEIKVMLKDINPNIVIYIAGITNIDICESNIKLANNINYLGVKYVKNFLSINQKLIYIGTDQVYPDTIGPHKEGTYAPVNNYGITKLLGSRAVLEHSKGLVINTNFFGPSLNKNRTSLSDFFYNNIKEKNSIKIFEDSYFSPILMSTLSQILRELIERNIFGIYNLGSRNGMSKANFAREIANHYNLEIVNTISENAEYIKGRVKRGLDLRLDVSLVEKVLGYKMRTLKEEIKLL
jgi:dTDP-4-dehydrorhamnose reductase